MATVSMVRNLGRTNHSVEAEQAVALPRGRILVPLLAVAAK